MFNFGSTCKGYSLFVCLFFNLNVPYFFVGLVEQYKDLTSLGRCLVDDRERRICVVGSQRGLLA